MKARITTRAFVGAGGVLLVLALSGCGSSSATRPAPAAVRAAIVSVLKAQFTHLHVSDKPVAQIDVGPVRLAAADTHFALTTMTPKDAKGTVMDNSAAVVLMEAGGSWTIVLGPGTAFPEECQRPTAHPIRELMCPNPFVVLGKG